MRPAIPLLAASLLALLVVLPPGAGARTAVQPASCTAAANGWKGEATGKKIAAARPAVERRVILLVNRFRRRHGVPALKLDPGLRSAARARGVIGIRLTARLALYTPSRCVVEHAVRQDGLRRAASIVRHWRSRPETRRALLLTWVRRIGVGVRIGTFKHKRVTITTVDFSAPRPTAAQAKHKAVKRQAAPILTPAPSTPAAVAAPVPSGPVVGVPYTCNGPVNGVRVVGTGSDARALVVLASGCTGTLSFDIHITSGGGDGVKVLGGVHDLTVGPSRVVCDRLTDTSFHQDGVQVQGGTNVLFSGLSIVCPFVTGAGAAGFYIDGKDFGGISNVVCDGCNLEHLHYGAMFTGPAPGSGVRNSIIHQGTLTHGYFDLIGDLAGALDSNNTLAPPCDDVTVAC
jgi:hypothetical protein